MNEPLTKNGFMITLCIRNNTFEAGILTIYQIIYFFFIEGITRNDYISNFFSCGQTHI